MKSTGVARPDGQVAAPCISLYSTRRGLLCLKRIASASLTGSKRGVAALLCFLCLYGTTSSKSSVAEALAPGLSMVFSAQENARPLRVGEALEAELTGGGENSFRISLAAGNFMHVVVEQQGIDVSVAVLGADGKELIEMDSPNDRFGPEAVSIVAPVAGDYLVEVRSGSKFVPAGKYAIKIEEVRDATTEDKLRVQAEQSFIEGSKLYARGGKDSLIAAAEKYKESLSLWRELKDSRGEAYALCNLGRVSRGQGNLPESVDFLQKALAIWQGLKNAEEQSFVLNEMGATYRDLKKQSEAIEYFDEALKLRRETGNRSGQAAVLSNIGLAHAQTGMYKKATEYYTQALSLLSGEDGNRVAITRNNLAGALDELGETSQALDNYRQALDFLVKAGNKRGQASLHNNIGKIYDTRGDFQEAQKEYEAALALYVEVKDQSGEAAVLDNMGMLYATRGDPETALSYFNRALPLRQQAKRPRGTAFTLHNLGYAYALSGDPNRALKSFEEALAFRKEAGDEQGQALTLANIGLAYMELGQNQEALQYYQQALEIQQKLQDKRWQAATLNKVGQAYALSGELTKALVTYRQALPLFKAVGDAQGEAMSLYGIASVARAQNDLAAARSSVEQAIDIVESLRTRVTSQKLRIAYFATKQNYYELDIDTRMQLHRLNPTGADQAEALSMSERARARNLLDILAEAGKEIRRGVDSTLIAEEQRLVRELGLKAENMMRLRNAGRADDAAFLSGQIKSLTKDLDEVQSRIRGQSKSYALLMQPRTVSLKEIQQLLDEDTLLLEYALGEERSYLWVVGREDINSYQLPGRASIERSVQQLNSLITYAQPAQGETPEQLRARTADFDAKYRSESVNLSRMILAPAAKQLKNKRLLIVADGELQHLPFGVLPLSAEAEQDRAPAAPASAQLSQEAPPLLMNHEMVFLPSASTLAMLREELSRRQPASKAVAVIADPVFEYDDPRLQIAKKGSYASAPLPQLSSLIKQTRSDLGGKFPRLLFSRQEAKAIAALAPAGAVMTALDFKASRTTAVDPALRQYRIVHFATHAVLDDENPELSGIVLSLFDQNGQPQESGFLRLHDIYNLNLPVELVVLSACQTGLGKKVRGEGLIGLTRGFMYAGAPRVVTSLWKVDDEATAALMKLFYQGVLQKRLSPAAALRDAQVAMREQKRWRSPYYWSGFVLQGEWK